MRKNTLPLKPIGISIACMILQISLHGISLIATEATAQLILIVCMVLILVGVVFIGIANKFLSPTLFCLIWLLTVVREQLTDTTQRRICIISIFVLIPITLISLGIEVAILRQRVRNLAANESS